MAGKIKAVIFDLDGVLIDARDWHYEALNRALRHFGFEISRYDHTVTYDGLPTRKKMEMLSAERRFPVGLHGFINDLKQHYTMEIIHTSCKPIFQHEYALSKLKHLGLKLAVASNSVRDSVETMMYKSNLATYLDLMLSNEDVKHAKPDPEIYLTAFKTLGMTPQECIIVEDNPNGIAAARAAGGHVVVVQDPSEVRIDLLMQAIQDAEAA